MSLYDGIETQPPTFNLMEHDHIDYLTVPNNVEGVLDERHLMTSRSQGPRGINRPRWAHDGHPMRFHCHDGLVNQGQWKLLVHLWDTVDAQEQVNGSKPDCITFFTLTHTRKSGELVDAWSAEIIVNALNRKLKLYEDKNKIVTDEVCHIVYADVLGPEKNNHVRGFRTGTVWFDVPCIIIETRGISKEVKGLRASYEEQRKAANIEIVRLRMEASEREERQRIESTNKNVDGNMVEPNGVDVIEVCLNRIEPRTGLEIQASGEVENEGFVVVQNIDMDDEIRYHPCMVNVTGISK
ncbi:unnamed protein product [Malus baccata var. baccata]